MIKRLKPGKRLSMATIHGGLVYLAGQVPDDLSVGVEAQASEVLAKIDALLSEAGTDKSSILSATVWLPNIADFAAFNRSGMSGCRQAHRPRAPASKRGSPIRRSASRSQPSLRFPRESLPFPNRHRRPR